jgi:TonB family protein
MGFALKSPALLLATIALWHSASPQFSVAQADDPHLAPQVVLSKLFPPVYPPLARQALIGGDVKVMVSVRPDGSIESVTSISGHPMLVQAALDSAKQSQFECRGCTASNGSVSLTFSFQVSQKTNPNPDACCCTYDPSKPYAALTSTVSRTEDHITITAPPAHMWPDACDMKWAEEHSKFRSAKCLFLWKCGRRLVAIE